MSDKSYTEKYEKIPCTEQLPKMDKNIIYEIQKKEIFVLFR